MKTVLQRVTRADVTVDGTVVAAIGTGICLLVGVEEADSFEDARALASKVAGLRVFADDAGKMNRSLDDVEGSILVISQFTLLGDVRRGRRPSFSAAGSPDIAAPIINEIVAAFRDLGVETDQGVFGAHMKVSLVNDGPVTLWLTVRDGKVL